MTQADSVLSTQPTRSPICPSRPQLAQDAFYLPIPTDAAQYAQASQGSLRQAVEAQIETLLAFLDLIDVDPDLEATTAPDDREGDETDNEPSLGWAEAETLQDVSSHVGGFGMSTASSITATTKTATT